MPGSEAHIMLAAGAALFAVLALVASAFTWWTSRAKTVRLVEDQVLSQLRAYAARADQVDTRIQEWQVTVADILGQVEEFFDRTVKERKRITQQNAMANRQPEGPEEVDMSQMTRAQQLEIVDAHFRGRSH